MPAIPKIYPKYAGRRGAPHISGAKEIDKVDEKSLYY